MDPNFVDHDLAALLARFMEYLIFILAFSTAIHGGVNGTFALFGISLEGKVDDFIKGGIGMLLAVMLDWNLFFYVSAQTNDQWVLSMEMRSMVPSGLFAPWVVILMCNILTGTLVVGGKKVIVGIADEFTSGVRAIKSAFNKKTEA